MDLLDFTDCQLYFEEPMPERVERLIAQASREYGEPAAETSLLQAHLIAPENLSVLVGLYRYYFYQHRLDDALLVAERAMHLAAQQLGLPSHWERLDERQLASAAAASFGLLRFYLLALKAVSVVLLRMGETNASRNLLAKLAALDSRDQFGAAKLLEVIAEFQGSEEDAHPATSTLATV